MSDDNAMMMDDGGAVDANDNNTNPNDDIDETPQFVTADDAVEVKVDDDNVPMEEDDDDAMDGSGATAATSAATTHAQHGQVQDQPTIPDMSQFQFAAHKGPVYAVRAHVQEEEAGSLKLSIVSGGGDDKAFGHSVVAAGGGAAATPPATSSQQLSHNHTDSVSAVAFNLPYTTTPAAPNNKKKPAASPRLVAVGGYDGAICLYNADTSELAQTLEGPTDVECLAWHPKGGTVLLAGSAADGTLWMYHVPHATKPAKVMQVFVGHESAVAACAFTNDGKWALTASSDGTLRQWAPRAGTCKHVFRMGDAQQQQQYGQEQQQQPGLTCLALQPPHATAGDNQLVLVGAEDGRAHVAHIANKKVVATLNHFDAPTTNSNNNTNGMMQDDGEEEQNLPMSVEAVGFAGDGSSWCATGGVDGVLKIWDLSAAMPHCRQVCRRPADTTDGSNGNDNGGGITRLQWHPTLPLCFTANTQGTVDLWDARNGQLLHSLTGHNNVLNDMDVQFIRNNEMAIVVTGSDDETVKVFEVNVAALWQQSNQQS